VGEGEVSLHFVVPVDSLSQVQNELGGQRRVEALAGSVKFHVSSL